MRTSTILLIVLSACSLRAQDSGTSGIRTLFSDPGEGSKGGFFSITTGYTQVLRGGGMLVGGQGGWMLGHSFTIGGGGYGLVTRVAAEPYDDYLRGQGVLARASRLTLGYGGVFMEAVVNYRAPVHFTFPVAAASMRCRWRTINRPSIRVYGARGSSWCNRGPGWN